VRAPPSDRARKGPGRPTPDPAGALHRHQVMLDEATVEALRALGEGNLSAGVRRAAALARQIRPPSD